MRCARSLVHSHPSSRVTMLSFFFPPLFFLPFESPSLVGTVEERKFDAVSSFRRVLSQTESTTEPCPWLTKSGSSPEVPPCSHPVSCILHNSDLVSLVQGVNRGVCRYQDPSLPITFRDSDHHKERHDKGEGVEDSALSCVPFPTRPGPACEGVSGFRLCRLFQTCSTP